MRKIAYTLSTCDTSKRILKAANISSPEFEIVDIKTHGISQTELEDMKALSGSYEALFSRRAQKYKSMGLKDKTLTETDYRDLILQEYTFLKRPVIIINDSIFIGNSKKNVESLLNYRAANK
ncbi:MAG: arsenate reductase [Bacteroidetes bacterium]|nr:MAG: arsenate reductase [Bacteroidota bacterium]